MRLPRLKDVFALRMDNRFRFDRFTVCPYGRFSGGIAFNGRDVGKMRITLCALAGFSAR